MKKILLSIFAILFVPFLGLPSMYDRWLLAVLILLLGISLFLFHRKNKHQEQQIDTPEEAVKKEEKEKGKEEHKGAAKVKSTEKKKEKEEKLLSEKDMEEIQNAVEKTKNN